MSSGKEALSRKGFADYQFILEELARMVKMNASELMNHYRHHREDALFMLRRPEGRDVPFSRAGEARFWQIATRGLHAMGPAGRKEHFWPWKGKKI